MTKGSLTKKEGGRFGKYTILEFLGKGGMAEVYKAKLFGVSGFEKIVVIKKIIGRLSSSDSFIKMFLDEAKITVSLYHPNIVQVFELGEYDGIYYMAMEYVEGTNLNKVIRHCSSRRTKVPFKHVIYVVMEICKALFYAHNAADASGAPLRVIHRDVTHSNILLTTTGHVKLADFGIARATIQESKEHTDVLKGKLSYMAPELIRGEETDHRMDIYSLGIVFYELLTMQKLFTGSTDKELLLGIVNHDVEKTLASHITLPDEIQDVLRRSLAGRKEDRYASAQEMYNDLNNYIFDNGIKVSPHDFADFLGALTSDRKDTMPPLVQRAEGASATPSTSSGDARRADAAPRKSMSIDLDVMKKFAPAAAPLPEQPPAAPQPAAPEPPAAQTLDAAVSALSQSITQQPTAPTIDVERKPSYAGAVKDFFMPRLLARLAVSALTGKLRLVAEGVEKHVYLQEGKIATVLSSLPEEHIQRYIMEGTSLPVDVLDEAAREAVGDNMAILLFAQKKIKRPELVSCVSLAYRDRIADIAQRRGATYEFFADEVAPAMILDVPADMFHILTPAVRKGYKHDLCMAAIGDRLGARLSPVAGQTLAPKDLGFNKQELFAAGLLVAGRELGAVIESQGSANAKAVIVRVAYILYQYEIIRFE